MPQRMIWDEIDAEINPMTDEQKTRMLQDDDYAELFKNWFGDGIEQKVVESAIVFWFKDADSKAENKVVEYFKEF